ncbi:MAG TPA: hypothetical protein VIV60_15865, partial [Polyangiaceae bacterium]
MRCTNPILCGLFVALLQVEAGCAARIANSPPLRSKAPESQANPQRIGLPELVVTKDTADNIAAIHERGMRHFQNAQWAEAGRDFALCVRVAPQGPFAASANYHAGLALDELGESKAALARFLAVSELPDPGELGTPAALRAVRIACHLEQWPVAAREAEWVLARKPEL